jgi:hypothetical protein
MAEIKYTELDFNLIKENLKNFLKSQDKFKDYNFDGSSISMLLDVLAYNTGYNAFYLNMLASEMFLDTASLRDSVVSRAKHLGYVPRSVRTLRATINYEIEFLSSIAEIPTVLIMLNTQEFFSDVDGIRYTFYPNRSTAFTKIGERRYRIENLELIEGKRFTHEYVVNDATPIKQRFVIPNENVDTSTISVRVKDSESSNVVRLYTLNTDILTAKSTDLSYTIQQYAGLSYEIIFGDGIIGKKPENGSIIIIDYVVSSGDGATGANSFRTGLLLGEGINPNGAIDNHGTPQTVSVAAEYSDVESIESIKLLAPNSYDAQNRAVTKNDYETLIKRDVSVVDFVRVWGGEENDPPEYGKVFCAIKPKTDSTLNLEDKSRIIESFIKPRSLVTVEVNIVDPEIIGITLDCLINYNANKTVLSSDSIQSLVSSAIEKYREENILGFDSDFRYSNFIKYLDNADQSIVSSNAEVKIKYRVIPSFEMKNSFSIQLNNSISKGDFINGISGIKSTEFFYNTSLAYLADDGRGSISAYFSSTDLTKKIAIEANVGSVNYDTGKIEIKNLLVSSIFDSINYIDFIVTPKVPDIIALRSQLIVIDDADVNITVIDINRLRIS